MTGSVQPAGQLLSVPETGPTTSLGGAVLEVGGGTAVLEGPGGIPNRSTGRCGPRHRAYRLYRALRPADFVGRNLVSQESWIDDSAAYDRHVKNSLERSVAQLPRHIRHLALLVC